ncbi:Hypothetical_protein [Hexamita inflata]|uniref:Hypothetical_protein n=1 Tax=Hexamita inflata TaxID=28002 RepID=A0AA86NPZ9_9EUKA|nr:Hypothetical protein HINF_LOCUS10806 [Hexamita inflata]
MQLRNCLKQQLAYLINIENQLQVVEKFVQRTINQSVTNFISASSPNKHDIKHSEQQINDSVILQVVLTNAHTYEIENTEIQVEFDFGDICSCTDCDFSYSEL